MPKYYCDYCDVFLTHDSPSVRKSHNTGWKHKSAVRQYYSQFEEDITQRLIDAKVKEYEGARAGGALPFFPPPQYAPGAPLYPFPPPGTGGGVLPYPPGMMPPPPGGPMSHNPNHNPNGKRVPDGEDHGDEKRART